MDEITLRIKKAEKLLKDAENELEMGMHERCCSSAYYAMFHAAKALLLSLGENSRNSQRDDILNLEEQRKTWIEQDFRKNCKISA